MAIKENGISDGKVRSERNSVSFLDQKSVIVENDDNISLAEVTVNMEPQSESSQ